MIKLTQKQMVQIWSSLKNKNTPNTWYNLCVLWFATGLGEIISSYE